ncbi:hypothetical protein fHeYen801_118 [Yersinia phage fHe-Yen8-01]|nr:hypothetical protein fHeYen801_118 [Yersinia phage fHe-Yen8-01]
MAQLFDDVKSGDTILVTRRITTPGRSVVTVLDEAQVKRVYKTCFILNNGCKYYKDGSRHWDGTYSPMYMTTNCYPVGYQGRKAITEEEEKAIKNKIEVVKNVVRLIMDVKEMDIAPMLKYDSRLARLSELTKEIRDLLTKD